MIAFIETNNLDKSYENALNNRICMGVLGLGLNECSKANPASTVTKIKNIKNILSDSMISKSYEKFNVNKFSIHWKLFYIFNKKEMALPSYIMINIIEFLRKRI